MEQHYLRSSYRERLVEHLFIGELLKYGWLKNLTGFEILRPEVDDSGYDLLVEYKGFARHIQLKSSFVGARASSHAIQTVLTHKPSGCVVWIKFDQHSMAIQQYLFFGGPPGSPLPSMEHLRTARRTTPNAQGEKPERLGHRVVPKSLFSPVSKIERLFELLFDTTTID